METHNAVVDVSKWSGEGDFTQCLTDHLRQLAGIASVRVEDAPSTRSEADYCFMSNEVFVEFETEHRISRARRWGVVPVTRAVPVKALTMAGLEAALAAIPDVGAPDYSDEGMLQYLRTQRIVPPYQTRGYKLIELVRIYEWGAPRQTAP